MSLFGIPVQAGRAQTVNSEPSVSGEQRWEGPGLTSLEATGQYRVVQWVGSPHRKGPANRRVARPWEASSNDRF